MPIIWGGKLFKKKSGPGTMPEPDFFYLEATPF
jgi:hypothetical protein